MLLHICSLNFRLSGNSVIVKHIQLKPFFSPPTSCRLQLHTLTPTSSPSAEEKRPIIAQEFLNGPWSFHNCITPSVQRWHPHKGRESTAEERWGALKDACVHGVSGGERTGRRSAGCAWAACIICCVPAGGLELVCQSELKINYKSRLRYLHTLIGL